VDGHDESTKTVPVPGFTIVPPPPIGVRPPEQETVADSVPLAEMLPAALIVVVMALIAPAGPEGPLGPAGPLGPEEPDGPD
jgi:hypothetical protein